jgi:hypothetical protein
MTQTVTATVQVFGVDEQTLTHFRETLPPEDQQVLDGLLFDSTQAYNLAVTQAAHTMPMELLLLTMLMEHHKLLQFLLGQMSYYDQKLFQIRVKQPRG